MARARWISILVCSLAADLSAQEASPPAPDYTFHHDLEVEIFPGEHRLDVTDRITVPAGWHWPRECEFFLHGGLSVEPTAPLHGGDIEPEEGAGVLRRRWRFSEPDLDDPAARAPRELLLRYTGTIHHALVAETEEGARSFSRTPGLIDPAGVYLAGSSYWVPLVGDELVRFRMRVIVPAGWDAVTSGSRTREEATSGGRRALTFETSAPMEEIHLIAGPLCRFGRRGERHLAEAYLRSADAPLAWRYLDATLRYLDLYSELIGPYPYERFAVVENFWESGWGMPSFTLLGGKILRFPFIIDSSHPHEILHNWWGNSVYVDPARGNWCEGLTAYLADHLGREQRGDATEYRRDLLAGYLNYVNESRDLSLAEFRERHSSASEAVGYGKGQMLWHMLRLEVGDAQFIAGLRRGYETHRFRRISYRDWQRVFELVADRDLGWFFDQWVERTGAPSLELGDARWERDAGLLVEVQERSGAASGFPPYRLRVPIAVTMAAGEDAAIHVLEMTGATGSLAVATARLPHAVELDPRCDVFRRLDPDEIPASVGQVLGSEEIVFVLPAPTEEREGLDWVPLAKAWAEGGGAERRIVSADEIDALPEAPAVWVLGSGNRFGAGVSDLLRGSVPGQFERDVERLVVDGTRYDTKEHSFVLTAARPGAARRVVGWIGGDDGDAIAGLTRKVPHYGRYSFLVFAGKEPANVAKGKWRLAASPAVRGIGAAASVPMPGRVPSSAPLVAHSAGGERLYTGRLMAHVRMLASDAMEGRGAGTTGLEHAADYIVERFLESGLAPGSRGGEAGDAAEREWSQRFERPGGPDGAPVVLRNIVGVLRGSHGTLEREAIVVGAHYDHLGRGWPAAPSSATGEIHNGADDNASGVAVLLDLADQLARAPRLPRSIVFVAFSGEEWNLAGSRRFVERWERELPELRAAAMINLDSVGRLEGKKLLVLGGGSSEAWASVAAAAARSAGISLDVIEGDPGGSDQRSFHEVEVPAIQVFTGTHSDYHRPTDDVEKVDAAGLARVGWFASILVQNLAEAEQPLVFRGGYAGGPASSTPAGKEPPPRRVSLGTIPDYAWGGPGVRITGVRPGSPAEAAGLAAGDVLAALDGVSIDGLRHYSEMLAARKPGERVALLIRRGEREIALEAELEAR